MDSCNENHQLILEAFRSQVADFLPDEKVQDDVFLLRWLTARDFNVDKALIMLKNCMAWRKDYQIDSILEWEPPEDLKKACPYEISFNDRSGRPVLLFPWGRWTPWDFTDHGRRDEYLKYSYQMLEKCVAAIKKPATQFTIIADSDGFTFRHMSRVKALEANLEVLRGYECRYPELMGLAIAVDCPKVFSLLFAVIKPLMSSRTQEKLELYDSNSAKWMKRLVHYISENDLPERYGGRRMTQMVTRMDNSQQGRDIEITA